MRFVAIMLHRGLVDEFEATSTPCLTSATPGHKLQDLRECGAIAYESLIFLVKSNACGFSSKREQ
jgi:hypothetical protein